MTLIELLVAGILGSILLTLAMGALVANQRAFQADIRRTTLQQNLRGALDLIVSELRQAGERLPSGFPAIEIIDGASGAPDVLITRRNVMDEVLTVCANLTTSSSTSTVALSTTAAGAPPACVLGGQTVAYNAWRTARLAEDSDQLKFYIYDLGLRNGEFLTYTGETSTGTAMSLTRSGSSWGHNYNRYNSGLYVLNEWRFEISSNPGEGDQLQLIENQDAANPRRVMFGLTDIQYRVFMQDGTVLTSFTPANSWPLISSVEVTISGQERYRGQTFSGTVSTRVFPRNILSN